MLRNVVPRFANRVKHSSFFFSCRCISPARCVCVHLDRSLFPSGWKRSCDPHTRARGKMKEGRRVVVVVVVARFTLGGGAFTGRANLSAKRPALLG